MAGMGGGGQGTGIQPLHKDLEGGSRSLDGKGFILVFHKAALDGRTIIRRVVAQELLMHLDGLVLIVLGCEIDGLWREGNKLSGVSNGSTIL